MLTLQTRRMQPDIAVVQLAGKITLGRESQQIEWRIDDLLKDKEKKVIFDVSGVSHIDSTGIGILVMCSAKMKHAGGELLLAGAQPFVEQVLRLTKVDQIVGMYTDADSAAKKFCS